MVVVAAHPPRHSLRRHLQRLQQAQGQLRTGHNVEVSATVAQLSARARILAPIPTPGTLSACKLGKRTEHVRGNTSFVKFTG